MRYTKLLKVQEMKPMVLGRCLSYAKPACIYYRETSGTHFCPGFLAENFLLPYNKTDLGLLTAIQLRPIPEINLRGNLLNPLLNLSSKGFGKSANSLQYEALSIQLRRQELQFELLRNLRLKFNQVRLGTNVKNNKKKFVSTYRAVVAQ